MVNWSNVVVLYFILGATMYGGGVVGADDAGLVDTFVDDPDTGGVNSELADDVSKADEPIRETLSTIGGGEVVALWGALTALLDVLFWPVVTATAVGAPASIIVLSGTLTASFFVGFLVFIRG